MLNWLSFCLKQTGKPHPDQQVPPVRGGEQRLSLVGVLTVPVEGEVGPVSSGSRAQSQAWTVGS